MKKKITLLFALTLVFAFVVPTLATESDGFIFGEVTEINENDYARFASTKESENNETIKNVGDVLGIDFICNNKDGWYLTVYDNDLIGSIPVAYKISNKYFIVTFEINGIGDYYVGDGRGSNGINHAKVGKFVDSDEEIFEFVGYNYTISEYALIKGFTKMPQMNTLKGSVTILEIWKSNKGNIEYRNEKIEEFSVGPLGSGASDRINSITFFIGQDKGYETECTATIITANRGGGPAGTVLESTIEFFIDSMDFENSLLSILK